MNDASTPATDATTPAAALREATPADEKQVAELLAPYVLQRKLLPRTDEELLTLIRNGFVIQRGDRIVGFAAVEIYSRKLAELQCLAVADDCHGLGYGKQLINACVERARERGVVELMAITSSEQLFMRCGFHYALPEEKKALFIYP